MLKKLLLLVMIFVFGMASVACADVPSPYGRPRPRPMQPGMNTFDFGRMGLYNKADGMGPESIRIEVDYNCPGNSEITYKLYAGIDRLILTGNENCTSGRGTLALVLPRPNLEARTYYRLEADCGIKSVPTPYGDKLTDKPVRYCHASREVKIVNHNGNCFFF